jgi:hypothetical protein
VVAVTAIAAPPRSAHFIIFIVFLPLLGVFKVAPLIPYETGGRLHD